MMFYVLLILINIVYVYSNNFIYLRHNYTQPQSLVTYTNCTTIGAYSNVCSNNGVCTSSQQCKCNKGYITFPSDHYPYCNYKQKSQLIAFLLEFFLGLEGGAGEFYIENKSFGITQLILFVTLIVISILLCVFGLCTMCHKQNNFSNISSTNSQANISNHNKQKEANLALGGCCGACYVILAIIAILALWIYCVITIGLNAQLDGNGASLESWSP